MTADTPMEPMEQWFERNYYLGHAIPHGPIEQLRAKAREMDARTAALEAALTPIAETKTRTESLALPILTDGMILAARDALAKVGAR